MLSLAKVYDAFSYFAEEDDNADDVAVKDLVGALTVFTAGSKSEKLGHIFDLFCDARKETMPRTSLFEYLRVSGGPHVFEQHGQQVQLSAMPRTRAPRRSRQPSLTSLERMGARTSYRFRNRGVLQQRRIPNGTLAGASRYASAAGPDP